MTKPKAPQTHTWVLTKQQWALFVEALEQQNAASQRLSDIMRGISAGFSTDLTQGTEVTHMDAKTRTLTVRIPR